MIDDYEGHAFLIRAGVNGEHENEFLSSGCAFITSTAIATLSKCTSYQEVRTLVATSNADIGPRKAAIIAKQLFTFSRVMREGDTVVLPRKGGSNLLIGHVAGPYFVQADDGKLRHSRAVKWCDRHVPRNLFGQDLLDSLGAKLAVCTLSRNRAALRINWALKEGLDPLKPAIVRSPSGSRVQSNFLATPADLLMGRSACNALLDAAPRSITQDTILPIVQSVLEHKNWEVTSVSRESEDHAELLAVCSAPEMKGVSLLVAVFFGGAAVSASDYNAFRRRMQVVDANRGLIVSWDGFDQSVEAKARKAHFSVQCWKKEDINQAVRYS